MKRRTLFLIVYIAGLLMPLFVYADPINTSGGWGGTKIRTFVPSPPEALIEGNVLSIYFIDALSNLAVTVSNESGVIVYQGIISGESSSTVSIPLEVPEGAYFLVFSFLKST